MTARTALVTGATSGIGYETAKLLAQKGYRVLGTSRNPDTVPADKRIAGVEYLALDPADRDSVAAHPPTESRSPPSRARYPPPARRCPAATVSRLRLVPSPR